MDMQSPCPLNNEEQNETARYNPVTKASAYCFQLHDMLRVLYGVSQIDDDTMFRKILTDMKSQIDTYLKG